MGENGVGCSIGGEGVGDRMEGVGGCGFRAYDDRDADFGSRGHGGLGFCEGDEGILRRGSKHAGAPGKKTGVEVEYQHGFIRARFTDVTLRRLVCVQSRFFESR